jgi:glutathione S-transferase
MSAIDRSADSSETSRQVRKVPTTSDMAAESICVEDSQLICAYLDDLDGEPRLHHALHESDWAYRRLEANARSMCEGVCVWVRQKNLPESERSPMVLAHEVARTQRMADFFEARVSDPLMHRPLGMSAADPRRIGGDRTQAGPR